MADHREHAPPLQLSLFPDAYELQAAALAALRDLDVPRARKLLDRVRQQSPRLVNLQVIHMALCLLESTLPPGPPGPAELALAVQATHDEWLHGRLLEASAHFVDETVARYWRRLGPAAPFLDPGRRVHRGVLELVLGDASAARFHLEASLRDGLEHRADLWCRLGDALMLLDRADEANACYVRALLLSAVDVDLLRTRLRPLAAIHAELRRVHDETLARALLFVEAWLGGVLEVPPENCWLDGQMAQLEARSAADPGSAPQRRHHRFAWLLYLDRSQPAARVELARREAMAALDPDLFARFLRECDRRERL
jgi:tetratricopeptide (TPR) repeat protein